MKARSAVAHALALLASLALSQAAAAQDPDQQDRLLAARQAAALNQQALHSYTWVEKVELSYRGKVRNTRLSSCRYGADGEVERAPIGDPQPPPEKKPGLRGRVIENNKEVLTEELQDAIALARQYVPPDSALMQVAISMGNASVAHESPAAVVLEFSDYVKVGDRLTLTFAGDMTAMRQIGVRSYVDDPAIPVSLDVTLELLPDGTRYPAAIVLKMPTSRVDVRIDNSNYQKLAP